MKIIGHRGMWFEQNEKNTITSFINCFDNKFGTETDIRDFGGNLVISHDIADSKSLPIDDFLKAYINSEINEPLALNIKSDGLQKLLKQKLIDYNIDNYFVFDMSIPDMMNYLNTNLKTFARISEFEVNPVFFDKIEGIWFDRFFDNDYSFEKISEFLNKDKIVCIVSPELHKRNYNEFWNRLKTFRHIKNDKLYLCTDFPKEAEIFFERGINND